MGSAGVSGGDGYSGVPHAAGKAQNRGLFVDGQEFIEDKK